MTEQEPAPARAAAAPDGGDGLRNDVTVTAAAVEDGEARRLADPTPSTPPFAVRPKGPVPSPRSW